MTSAARVHDGSRGRARRPGVWVVVVAMLASGSALLSAPASALTSIEIVDTTGGAGARSSMVLDGSGHPVIAYYDGDNRDLKLAHCNDPNCAGNDESIVIVDATGSVGDYPSLVLDSAGNPVIAYADGNTTDLKVAHCNDPNCVGNDESITTADTSGGRYTSLVLDASGNPVIAHYQPGLLRLTHCNDPNCAGNDESAVTVDDPGVVGSYASLALDGVGNPVISYIDGDNDDLKLAHCNDPNCTGNDESIVAVDTGNIGSASTSLALDVAGHPVIAYYDGTSRGLKLAHCNDPNCTGNNEDIVDVDDPPALDSAGVFNSLVLDGAGHPVIAYRANGFGYNQLRLVRCNDPNCSGNNESIITVDDSGNTGLYPSLVLDGAGHPVIAYEDFVDAGNGSGSDILKLAHCDNPTCVPTCDGLAITVDLNAASPPAPTAGDDVILGTPGNDVISGLGGNDTICGEGGDDTIAGGPGDDTVLGGDGVDTIFGGDGNDTLSGGSGNDTIQGNADNDSIDGDAGSDTLSGNDGDDTLTGGSGNDEIYGVAGADIIDGGNDNDTILGGLGADTIDGGNGQDLISGNGASDVIDGGDNDDTLYGVDGNDQIDGGPGNDVILGGIGNDTITGGDGTDKISGNENNDTIDGGPGNDEIYGVAGDDELDGGDGNDTILGGAGNDDVFGEAGDDLVSGNEGDDNVGGGPDDDEVYGADGDDKLSGGEGIDIILGGNDNDTILAADGQADQVSGNNGTDNCERDPGLDTVFACETLTP